jgi:hypothetical protein
LQTNHKYQFSLLHYFGMRRFSKISSSTRAVFTSVRDVLGRLAPSLTWQLRSAILEIPAPFCDMPHSRYVIIVDIYQPAVNFEEENEVPPTRTNCFARPKISSVTNSPHEKHLTAQPSVVNCPYCKCCHLPKQMKCFNNTKVSKKNSTSWNASYKHIEARETYTDVWYNPLSSLSLSRNPNDSFYPKHLSLPMQDVSHRCWTFKQN